MLRKSILIFTCLLTIASAQQWQLGGKMPLPVASAQLFVVDSLIYILGGYSDSLQQGVSWIQVFNPEENTWRIAGNMNLPRYGFVADRSTNNKIFICGGIWSNANDVSTLEEWDFDLIDGPGPQIQSNRDAFNRNFASGHIYNNQLFLFGGLPSPVSAVTTALDFIVRYQLSNSELTRIEDTLYNSDILPYHLMSLRMENIVYLFGGVYFGISNRILEFNLDTYSLTDIGQMNNVRAGGSVVYYQDHIYIIGGYNESNQALSSVDVFSINMKNTVPGPALNFNRADPMAVVYGNKIYVFGGKDRFDQTIEWIETLELTTTATLGRDAEVIDGFSLDQNQPNPFNSATQFEFTIAYPGQVTVDVYTITGQHIKQIDEGYYPAGTHQLRWDGTDRFSNAVASGIYIYQMRSGRFIKTRKMILIR